MVQRKAIVLAFVSLVSASLVGSLVGVAGALPKCGTPAAPPCPTGPGGGELTYGCAPDRNGNLPPGLPSGPALPQDRQPGEISGDMPGFYPDYIDTLELPFANLGNSNPNTPNPCPINPSTGIQRNGPATPTRGSGHPTTSGSKAK